VLESVYRNVRPALDPVKQRQASRVIGGRAPRMAITYPIRAITPPLPEVGQVSEWDALRLPSRQLPDRVGVGGASADEWSGEVRGDCR